MAGGEVKFPLVDNHWFKAVIIYICLSSWKHRFSFCLLFQLPFCYSMTLHYTLTHLSTFMETVKKKNLLVGITQQLFFLLLSQPHGRTKSLRGWGAEIRFPHHSLSGQGASVQRKNCILYKFPWCSVYNIVIQHL